MSNINSININRFYTGLNKNKIKEYRGIVLVSCFIFGMIFTPPDVISQILLAVPMYLLFELGLLFSNEKKKKSNS